MKGVEADFGWWSERGISDTVRLFLSPLKILVGLKIYSAISSKSSSVLASLVENFMDVISNIILIIVNIKVKRYQPYAYPHGKYISHDNHDSI